MSLAYLTSLILPLTTLAFLIAPRGPLAMGWALALLSIAILDERLPPLERRARAPARWITRLPDAVALLQLVVFGLFVWRVGRWGWSWQTAVAVPMVGVGGAFSSLISAHELIHRAGPSRWLGRLLLGTTLYDQFFVDHLRGHHRTAGTPADVLTARRDESFLAYFLRSWPAELGRAWSIDRVDVLRGVFVELALLAGAGLYALPATAAIIAQAAIAHLLAVAVNFIEHWGIVRLEKKFRGAHAWDTDAPLSHYALLGLSFHADHHVRASRPFDDLVLQEDSPRLPYGYFKMIGLVLTRSARVRELLAARLPRTRIDA